MPPLGLLYVAAAAERAGYRVVVVDAEVEDLSDGDVLARLRPLQPAVLGLTGMTPMREDIRRAARALRPVTARLILGGVHATRFRHDVLIEVPELDALVLGEGEDTIVELLRHWSDGAQGPPPPGVAMRGWPIVEAAPPRIDTLPRPARHLVPHGRYRYLFQTRRGAATMISSRGCPFRCSFCDKTISGDDWRARAAEDVVDEVVELNARFGVGYLCFFDDNFTLRRKRVVRICEEMIHRDVDVHWKAESRADGMTPDLASLMARAGCKTVAFGVESGNAHALDVLQKDQDPARVLAAIQSCRAAGIETVGYVMIGIPGESPAQTVQTLDFCVRAGLDFIQFSTLSPFPGTALYDEAVRQGWFRETAVRNPADAEQRRATLLPPGWDEEMLDRRLRDLYGGFYLRPEWMLHQGRRLLASGGLKVRAASGLSLLRWFASSASANGRSSGRSMAKAASGPSSATLNAML